MKKKLHEHSLQELLLKEGWYSDAINRGLNMRRSEYTGENILDHIPASALEADEKFKAQLAAETQKVKLSEEKKRAIEQVMRELSPDGWSEALLEPFVINGQTTITPEELLEDMRAIPFLHLYAQKMEASLKLLVSFLSAGGFAVKLLTPFVFAAFVSTSTAVSLSFWLPLALVTIVGILGLFGPLADGKDILKASPTVAELKDISGSSPIVRYLPLSDKAEDILPSKFWKTIEARLEKRIEEGNEQFDQVNHFQNWALYEWYGKQDPTEDLGKEVAAARKNTAYDVFIDWSGLKDHVQKNTLAIKTEIIKLAARRWASGLGVVADKIKNKFNEFKEKYSIAKRME